MNRTLRVLTVVAVVTILLLPAAPASGAARTGYPVVRGTVTDLGGQPVPGARVDIAANKGGDYVPVTTVYTDGAGQWSYTGKQDDYRFVFSATGADPVTRYLLMERGQQYTLDVMLNCGAPPVGTISGRVLIGAGTPMNAWIYFYKQNADGTWPTTYMRVVQNDIGADGAYTSGDLPLGTYKVRFFGVHTGVQWWENADTQDAATPITLDTPGQQVTGIDGWFR